MTRDYRPPRQQETRGSGRALFLGILLGLVMGIGIAAAVALYVSRIPNPFAKNTDATERPGPTQEAPSALATPEKASGNDKERFDFYKILPGEETANPGKVTKAGASGTGGETKPGAALSNAEEAKPAGAATMFYLQAGAFQSESDADNQKAKLALLGFDAQVRSASVPDKGTVYRVRVGPYETQNDANGARDELKQSGITATVVKIAKAGN